MIHPYLIPFIAASIGWNDVFRTGGVDEDERFACASKSDPRDGSGGFVMILVWCLCFCGLMFVEWSRREVISVTGGRWNIKLISSTKPFFFLRPPLLFYFHFASPVLFHRS